MILTVDVEAWIDLEYGTVEVVELVAAVVICTGGRGEDREGFLGRGELEIGV